MLTQSNFTELEQDPQFKKLHTLLSRFNIFSALNIEHFEIRHSNVLAWLLTPLETHQLQNRPLCLFLEILRSKHSDISHAHSAIVKREMKLANAGQIDLLLYLDSGEIIALENKVKAGEGENQLKRYRTALEKLYPHTKIHYLFLTPAGDSPKTDDEDKWKFVSYDVVTSMLTSLLQQQNLSKEIRVFLEHYLETVKREVLMNKKETEELCTQLYEKYQAVFDTVMEYKQDIQTQIKCFLVQNLTNAWNQYFILDRAFKNSITFYFREFEKFDCLQIDETVDYGGWKQPKNALTFEFKVQNGNLILKLMILASKKAGFKEFLLTKIQGKPPFNKGKQGNKWERILEKTVLEKEKYDNVVNILYLTDCIKKFMDDFLHTQYEPIKSALLQICQDYERENAQ